MQIVRLSFAPQCWRIAAAIGLVAVASACGSSDSSVSDAGARIVFQSDRDGSDDIYVMREDGSDIRRLTDAPGRDYEPDSSPDGQTLTFVSDRSDDGNTQLYLMSIDGSDVRRLTFRADGDATVVDDYPHWSPSGGEIVFQRTGSFEGQTDADIWLVDVETGEETQLTDTPESWESTPSYSADGQSILFESDRDGDFDIYRLDLASGDVEQLTDAEFTDLEAKASPDGTQISFGSARDGDFDIYVMDIDGSNVRQLTNNDAVDRCPHWSPNGERFTFFSDRDGNAEIYIMNVDGTGQQRLTNDPARDEVPEWVHEDVE